jgi:hypothetical protein
VTATEILTAWRAAAASGRFYEEFERLTSFPEAEVRRHFAAWGKLRHETAEEIAIENGVTVREGGFQAYLSDVKRRGGPRMSACVDFGYGENPNDIRG